MSLSQIIKEFKWSFFITISLLLFEAATFLLFPLFIGQAVDDATKGIHEGPLALGLLGALGLVLGAGRRFFDSRFYAKVFVIYGSQMISKIKGNLSSIKTARLGMIRELVEFLEHSLPELLNSIIGLLGVMTIIAALNFKVFIGCFIATGAIFSVYWMSRKKTLRLNKAYNDEIETQVDIINENNKKTLASHLIRMMHLNTKLSDLETINFSVSWLALMAFLVWAIIISVGGGLVKYGALFALIMYVFQYIESIINLPFFYEQWLRLKEIKQRLEHIPVVVN